MFCRGLLLSSQLTGNKLHWNYCIYLTLVLLRYFCNTSSEGRLLQTLSLDFLCNGTSDTPIFATSMYSYGLFYPLIPNWVSLNFIWHHCDVRKSARPFKFGCIENVCENKQKSIFTKKSQKHGILAGFWVEYVGNDDSHVHRKFEA